MNALDCWKATVESETCRPSSRTFPARHFRAVHSGASSIPRGTNPL